MANPQAEMIRIMIDRMDETIDTIIGELRTRLENTQILEERMRLALRAGNIGTYDFDPRTQVTQWDDELYDIWGIDKCEVDIFTAIKKTIHPEDVGIWQSDVDRAMDPNGGGRHDVEIRILRPDTGELRWIHAQGIVLFEQTEPIRLVGSVRDITSRKINENRERLFVDEMNHRMKNVFAVMMSLIRVSAVEASSTRDLSRDLCRRIDAMSKSYELVTSQSSKSVFASKQTTLSALCEVIFKPFQGGNGRIVAEGPECLIDYSVASDLSLVFQEWATNSVKYGALSEDGGHLIIKWVEDKSLNQVMVSWTEWGGPPLARIPDRAGFGTRLVAGTLNEPNFAQFETSWQREGVRYDFAIRLPEPETLLRVS